MAESEKQKCRERKEGYGERSENRMKKSCDVMKYKRNRKSLGGKHLIHLMVEDADTQQEMEDYGNCWEVCRSF